MGRLRYTRGPDAITAGWAVVAAAVGVAVAVVVTMLVAMAGTASASAGPSVAASIKSGNHGRPLRITITRNGHVVYARKINQSGCGSFCTFTAVPPGRSAVRLVDLDANGEPEVVLGLYTGGAHCCFVDQVFSFDRARNTYVETGHDFLDAGAVVKRVGGHEVFLSADARIAENAFTDYADSGAPIQIWNFAGSGRGRFTDITRRFPGLIRTDAARWMRAFNHHIANGVGFIAAWAADEYLLGNGGLVRSTLASEARRGRLHSALGLPHNSPQRFVTDLQKFLRRLGYTK